MNGIVPAIFVAFGGSLVLVFTYLSLYRQERRKYLAVWLVSWGMYATRCVLEILIVLKGSQVVLVVLNQVSVLWSAIFLLWGTYLFLEKRTNGVWLALVAGTSLWIVAAMLSRFSSPWAAAPVFLVSAFANVSTGLALLRFKQARGPVRLITGWAFIFWGVHKVDYPLLRPFDWAAPYGYIVGAAFGFLTAIGIILLYLERTKNELKVSEQKYRSIFENAAEGIFQTTADGRFLQANPALARMCGYESPEELMGSVDDIATKVYADHSDRKRLQELIREKGSVERFETRIYRKGGEVAWISVNARAVDDARGEIAFYEGSIEDITERKRSEKDLYISRLQLSEAADLARIAYWEQDDESADFIFNDAFYTLYGTTADREGGYRMAAEEYTRRFVHPDDRQELHRKVHENMARGRSTESGEYEHRVVRPDGGVIHILSRSRAVFDSEGRVAKVVGVNQDITEHRAAEETLRATAARLMRAAEVSRTGNWELDLLTQTMHGSLGASRIYGLTGDEWSLAAVWQAPLAEYREILAKSLQVLIEENAPYDVEFKIRRADNGNVVDIHSVAEYDADEKTVFGVIQDVTEKKRLEEQLRQAQKMEAIGTLAGGVAHDFNNLLTVIIGFADLVQMHVGREDRLSPYVDQIVASSNKAAELTRSLLAFSRKQRVNLEPRFIDDVLTGSAKLLKRLLPEDIELTLELTAKDAIVRLDLNQIEQVLMNLATNARDAMPQGGRLTVSTRLAAPAEEFERCHGLGKSSGYVVLSIADTGSGMDEKTRERIFDPFFTTKSVDKGTGLGLASVYGIVTQHEGHITVSSKIGEGSIFDIYLPVGEAVGREQIKDVNAVKGGSETILVVEDDPDVRKMMKRILEGSGYATLEAANGEEGVHVHERHKKEIDLVILDVVMPGKNGKDVLDEITRGGSKIKAIFVSGYAGDIILDKGVRSDRVDFLPKPLSVSGLLSKVREVLDR